MICPYCDSLIRELPDSRTCPQCGAPLGSGIVEKQIPKKKLVFPEPPIGIYKFSDGYMQLAVESVRIYKKYLGHEVIDHIIPYSEIESVSFIAGRRFKPGFLCIRNKQDKFIPHPTVQTAFLDTLEDRGIVSVHISNNEKFYCVFAYLRQCADIVRAANLED